ncbi:MAG TPA: hypothetical protein VIE65_20120 [Methylobacter sp.]|jgi:hypothetical protein
MHERAPHDAIWNTKYQRYTFIKDGRLIAVTPDKAAGDQAVKTAVPNAP